MLFSSFACICLEKLVQCIFIVTMKHNLMISQWILQKILGWSIHADAYLRAAHINIIGIFSQCSVDK